MTDDKDGGPAFPIPNMSDLDGYVYAADARGMSLRDWFAGQALAGIMASGRASEMGYSREAYLYADDMLRTRKEPGQ